MAILTDSPQFRDALDPARCLPNIRLEKLTNFFEALRFSVPSSRPLPCFWVEIGSPVFAAEFQYSDQHSVPFLQKPFHSPC